MSPDDRVAAEGMTPGTLRMWLDAAETHRPRSDRHDEYMFAMRLAGVASDLVSLAARTGERWNQLLSHPVFTSPMVTVPEPPPKALTAPVPSAPAPSAYAVTSPAGAPQEALEVAAFVVTAGLVPFLQTIAAQAAQRTFDAARATIRARLGRGGGRVSGPQLVIEERGGREEFRVPSDIPDAALEALAALGERDLERLARRDSWGRVVSVAWNPESRRWERSVHRR